MAQKAKIPEDAYSLDEVHALESAREAQAAKPQAPGKGEWPNPQTPTPGPKTTFQKDGYKSVLWDEMLHGHAPNAVEPTTAAQIVAPMMMGAGAMPLATELGEGAIATEVGPAASRLGAMAKSLGLGGGGGAAAGEAAKHGGGGSAILRKLIKVGAGAFGLHEVGKMIGGGHH